MRYAFVLSLRWPVIWTWLARNSLFCINCLRGQTSLIISLRKGLSLPPTSFTFILKIFLCFRDSPSPPTFFFLFLLPESTAVVTYVFPVEKYNHSAVCSCLLIKIKKIIILSTGKILPVKYLSFIAVVNQFNVTCITYKVL